MGFFSNLFHKRGAEDMEVMPPATTPEPTTTPEEPAAEPMSTEPAAAPQNDEPLAMPEADSAAESTDSAAE